MAEEVVVVAAPMVAAWSCQPVQPKIEPVPHRCSLFCSVSSFAFSDGIAKSKP